VSGNKACIEAYGRYLPYSDRQQHMHQTSDNLCLLELQPQ